MSVDRTRVAVVFGGRSSEHEISCLSASSVLEAIDRDRYEVQAVGIAESGAMYRVSDQAQDWQRLGDVLPRVAPTEVPVTLADLDVDVVVPVLHGPNGEDGTIQGALEMLDIPYVGSGVLASALTMDKLATKSILRAHDLPDGPYVGVTGAEWVRNQVGAVAATHQTLAYPVFVKPARMGSSIGISRVKHQDELIAAIELARGFDRKVVIEQGIEGAREIECGVLADFDLAPPRTSTCAEIAVGSDHDFYDFDAKYLSQGATLTVPAAVSSELMTEFAETAASTFLALDIQGLARVDFFLTQANEIFVNEVNTMPGFTSTSMFPRMWEASGLPYPKVVDQLIQLALQS